MNSKEKSAGKVRKPQQQPAAAARSVRAAPVGAAKLPPLTGVPAGRVGEEVQSFVDGGVHSLDVRPEAAGTFSIAPV